MPTRLTLISHAATQSQRRAAFSLDEPIEDDELKKIASLSWQAPRAQQILAAPELRTEQTAEALTLIATPTPELRDLDYGLWRGRTLNDLYADDAEAIAQWLTDATATPHHGESIAAVIARTAAWLNTLHDNGHTIAITHPAIIRSAILHALNAPPQSFWRIDISPLTLTDLRHNGRAWTLRSTAIPLSNHDKIDT